MIHDDFETQIQCDEVFNVDEAMEAILEQEELDFVNAELQLAAEVEENYEHHDYRDELFEDELDIIDSDISFDDMVDSFSRFDDVRDLDYYES